MNDNITGGCGVPERSLYADYLKPPLIVIKLTASKL